MSRGEIKSPTHFTSLSFILHVQVFTYRCRLLPDDKIQAEIFHDVELPFIPPRFGECSCTPL